MGRKNKKVIARILAVLMAFTLLPFDLWGNANVVMAEEPLEVYTEEAAEPEEDTVAAENVADDAEEDVAPAQSATDEQNEKTDEQNEKTNEQDGKTDDTTTEDVTNADEEEETPASENDVQASEEDKDAEVEEEEKVSADADNTISGSYIARSGSVNGYFGYSADGKALDDPGQSAKYILLNGVATAAGANEGGKGRLTLGGDGGTFATKSINFTVTEGHIASINVYAISTKDSVNATLGLYNKDGDVIETATAYGAKMSIVDNKNYGTKENPIDITLAKDGLEGGTTYYIAAVKGQGANVYYIEVSETDLAGDKEKAAAPTANPESGQEVKVGSTITLECAISDAKIYYTTDGSDPKTNNENGKYDGGIKIEPTMVNENNEIVIKAYAVSDDYAASDVKTFTYTALKGDNQLDPPTAEPDDTEAVIRGTEITLKSNDESASIYYTFDETLQLKKNNGEPFNKDNPIVIDEEKTIKAIAVAEGKTDSLPAIFEYTIKTPTIDVADDSKDIISGVEMKGDVIFKNQSDKEVFDIKLSAEKKSSVSDAISEKAESIKKEGGEILHYDLTLNNGENESDKVSVSEGMINIKFSYSIASSKISRKNEITVLKGTEEISKVRKDVDGIFFSTDNVDALFTIIINPALANEDEDDETAPKTYILDPEELELGDLALDKTHGTDGYFSVFPATGTGKTVPIMLISKVTTGDNINCYDNLSWPDDVMEAIGGGRKKCLRITGGSLPSKGKEPANCVKITTTTPNANVVVYFSPKDTTSRKIKVAKDNAGKIGDSVGTYPSSGVTCKNMGTAKFTLAEAGTYYIGFDGGGGIITYMEVTETPEVPVIDMPTADPVSGSPLNRKSEITLNTDVDGDGVEIYYTTNGDDPVKKEDTVNKKYTAPIAVADLTVNNNKIIIKAITTTKSAKSEVATFEYDYDPNAVAIVIDEDSKAIIKAVEAVGNVSEVTRGGQTLQVTDITVKAQELSDTEIDNEIKTAAEALVTDTEKGNIKYYNISLILNDDTEVSADTVTFNGNAALKIKMPYSIFKTDALGDVTEENPIFVLHNTEQISEEKITKEVVISQNAKDAGVWFETNSFSPYTVIVNPAPIKELGTVKISKFEGYEEGAYAEWEAYEGADGYKAYIAAKEDGNFVRIDNALIREYKDHWRVDTVGLTAGSSYYLKVEAVKVKIEGDDENVEVLAEKVVGPMTVTNYDRSGFAFSSESPFKSGSGAYQDNGQLKDGAQVIYVTKDTAKTCKAMIHTGGASKPAVEVTGLQSILDAKQKKGTEKDILDIRIIGRVSLDDLDHISSTKEGLQVKGAANYNEMNITIEGIGEDAVVHGFGFLIRNCGNVELRNFAIMAFMDDGVSLDTANCNIWVHDLDIFYGATGGDSDQAKGDGSVDVKGKSTYVTISYNHFWDSGKCSLCGMGDSEEFMVTYHHNWFDHSDSRHPRIRVGSIHVYNNYFDGNSKYGVGVTKGSSAFVEANYFRNCKYPMLISQQASDLSGDGKGTFSGEPGGIIKAYANKIEGAQRLVYANEANGSIAANATDFDAYLAKSREEKVPSSYVTKKGGTSYNNFDTGYDLGVKASAIDSADKVKDIVTQKAGRLNGGDFKRKPGYSVSNDDQSYGVDTVLKADVVNYQSSVIYIGGIKGAPGDSGSGGGSGSGSGSGSGGNTPGDTPGGDKPGISGGGIYAHNFTTDGFTSDNFFTINGNKQSKPTTVSYVDPTGTALTLTQALKMESSTKISFNAAVSGTLIIVLVPESGKTGKTKVDGVNQDPADGIIEIYFETAGAHTIQKGDKADIYYIAYIEDTYDTNEVREPVLNIPSGNLPMGTPLTMTCETEDAEIYYTTDGTNPTSGSEKYLGTPIVLEGAEGDRITVKAIAIKGEKESIVVTCTYTFVDPNKYVAEPVASEDDGPLEKGTPVTLSSLTEDAEIYYTYKTDGTQPDDPSKENGTLYNGPIIISRTSIIKAIAIKGELKSEISTFQYTVSSGGSGSETTGSKKFEFNPQKIGFTLDETEKDSNGNEKKLYKMPAKDTKYGTDNYFTIGNKGENARITENKLNMPEGNKSDITEYKLRYQFGGSASTSADPKTIRFTTYGKATVYVGAYGSDETRKLLLDSQSKNLTKAPAEYTFSVEKGAHAICADKDYYILYVIVEDTDVPGAGDPSGGEETGVSRPVATPPSGTCYEKGTEISLGAELGAKIYYTTDNSDPTTDSTLYTTEIVLEEDLTIKAIAELDGKVSEIVTFEYKVKEEDIPPVENKVSEPEPNYASGTKLIKGTEIELTCDTQGAQIYYTFDEATEPSRQSTLYTEPIPVNADITIKAIAVKESYLDSEIITLRYTVFENDNVKQVEKPKADIASGTKVKKGTKVKLECDTEDAKIYYTLDDTAPNEQSTLYTKPIPINADTTLKAVAIKPDWMSSEIATFEYTVTEEDIEAPTIPEGVGLRVVFKKPDEVYTYTGSAIKPDIVVWNNNDRLVEGADYVVKYTNNINASAGAKENKKPKITVTGKGNLTGSASATFEIEKKKLDDSSEGAGSVVVGGLVNDAETGTYLLAVEKSKLSPALYYGGVKLTNKDFGVSKTDKCEKTDEGKEITITGKGNFDGTCTYKLKVIGKNELKKFTVAFTAPNYIYNGEPQKFELAEGDVKDADGKALVKDTDYTIVYQKDLTNAGTVKLTVVGLGYYNGSITKSYTIKPNAVTSGMEISGVDSAPYPYTGIGVTIPNVGVTYKGIQLAEGRDYKLAYGNNKKIGTAKLTVSFIGNYKGSKAISKTFTIGANALSQGTTEGLKIVVGDMVYNKPGVYKSVPYVSINGAEVKSSEYVVKYYTDEEYKNEMGSKNKITLSNDEPYKNVYMEIIGKEKGNYQGTKLFDSYKVYKKAGNAIDLSKAKVTVYTDWSDSAVKTNKLEYTGKGIEPGAMIEIKQGNIKLLPKEVKQLEKDGKLTITYTNNIQKGKAVMVINGDGDTYVGSKAAAFSITTKNIKNTKILDDLFTDVATMCNIRYLLETQ